MNKENRYKMFGNYKVDKLIIQVCMYLTFIFLFYVAYHYNFQLDYYSCKQPFANSFEMNETLFKNTATQCKNPFYTPPTWKNEEFLSPGEYGTKPGLLFNSIPYVIIGLFIVGFGLNHLIYNRGKNERNNNNINQ